MSENEALSTSEEPQTNEESLEGEVESLEEVNTNTDPSPETTEEPQTYTVKVNGEEMQVTLEELQKNYSLEQASRQRFEESASKLKQVEELFAIGKEDPTEILTALGIDPLEWMQKHIEAKLEEASLSPEERELKELRRFKEEQDLKLKQSKEEQEAKIRQEQTVKVAQEVDNEIISALQELNIQNPSPRVIGMVADAMLNALDSGKPIDAKTAVQRTRKTIHTELQSALSEGSVEELISGLDAEAKKRVREIFLKEANQVAENRAPQGKQSKSKKSKSFNDVFKNARLL